MALTPGTRFGPYEITAQIGVGGMGEVYRATDTKLKRDVAVKVNAEDIIRPVTFRRQLIELLSGEPRSVSSLARELGITRKDIEADLQHALRSARAASYTIDVLPARCKACGFLFDAEKLSKPSRCPACKGTRLFEPMIRAGAGR